MSFLLSRPSLRRPLSLLVLALAACSGGAQGSSEAGAPAGPPSASVSTQTAAPGEEVQITATGFAPNTRVEIGFGPPNAEYSVVTTARTGARGTLEAGVRVPTWAERDRDYVWVVAEVDNQPKAVTNTFRVAGSAHSAGASGEGVRVEGRITDEGVECPALRTADGTLYTLAGAPGWVSPGDRVAVRGDVAEMSFCQQGTTISVRSIERLG